MRKFTDAAGRDWMIEATRDSLRRVKELAGIDLLTGEGLARVTDHQDLWALLEAWPDVLWALCQPQCQAAGVSQQQWAELLLAEVPPEQPPVFDGAVTAALEEIASFFRRLGRLTAAEAIMKIVQTKRIKEGQLAARMGATLDQAIEREMETTLRQLESQLSTLGMPSTSSPASSASNPGG